MNNYSHLIDNLGLWSEVISKNKNLEKRPALFLDRDGTIVEEIEYLHEPSKVRVNKNISSLIKSCNLINIPVIEITNQSGIGRGLYNWNDFNNTEKEIRKKLLMDNSKINMLCACAFHHEAIKDYKIKDHFWRKPNSGMLIEASNIFSIKLEQSWIIGDKISDMQAAINAGIKGGILYNVKKKNFKPEDNFIIEFADSSDDLNWLINKFKE
jgi:D-glycero-D-manno-heptose 1,7-bisphosphate phosphatase